MTELDEILAVHSEQADGPKAEVAAAEPEAVTTQTDGDAGEVTEKAKDTGDKGSTPEPEQEQKWQMAALLDERDKRQKLQAELDQLRAQESKKDQKKPSVFDDEEGFRSDIEGLVNKRVLQATIDLSREIMMAQKEDYQERENQFAELAKADPALREQLKAHPNPARFAYETAVKADRLKEFETTDVSAMKAQIAELQKQLADASTAKPAVKRQPSLANVQSQSSRDEIVEDSLAELFGT